MPIWLHSITGTFFSSHAWKPPLKSLSCQDLVSVGFESSSSGLPNSGSELEFGRVSFWTIIPRILQPAWPLAICPGLRMHRPPRRIISFMREIWKRFTSVYRGKITKVQGWSRKQEMSMNLQISRMCHSPKPESVHESKNTKLIIQIGSSEKQEE